ncbi:sigma factor-like helix-turn-helix DNA-binding protein [Pedobacter sp. GR22-6]|uniref:sigma factor-like helix-turn-helix DNA-binding protein n=1 Tax=Pedobacter sp. GR22-6 TaxID=3127957 RepID=UPI00307D00DF
MKIPTTIRKALSALHTWYAVPFLRYFEGNKYQEIADELNIPIGTVMTRIHMARKELQKSLKMYAYGFQPDLKTV